MKSNSNKTHENTGDNTDALKEALKKIALLEEENKKLKEASVDYITQRNLIDIAFKNTEHYYSWSWIKRICFVIYKAQRPLKSDEVRNELEKIDEQFKAIRFKTKMLSFYFWQAARKGRLKRFKIVGDGGYYYAL